MKLRKLNKLGIIAVAATSLATITVPLVTSCGNSQKKDDKIKEEYFEIVDGEIKGFNQSTSKATLEEYCKDGVLRLPAAKSIAANAFNAEMLKDAPFATTIEINNTTTKIGERAFYANTATTVNFVGDGKSQLVEIDDSAFAFCTNLTSFKFPEKMFTNTSIIQDSAFFGCSSLNQFDCSEYGGLTQVIPQWSFGAFKGTNKTGHVIFAGSESSSEMIKSNFAALWSRLVFAGIKPAWDECWNNTSTLWSKQVKAVPVEYLKIESGELKGANEKIWPLTDIDFNAVIAPSTVTSLSSTIKDDFFAKRTNVTTWSFTSTTFSAIPDGAFSSLGDGTKVVQLWLPTSVKTIGASAFKSCKWVVDFASYANITTIGASAFESSSITKFIFPTGCTSVGNDAFKSCTNLVELDFSAWTTAPSWTGTGIFTSTGSSTTASNYKVKVNNLSNVIDRWELKESHKSFLNNKGMTIDKKTGNTWIFDPTCSLTYENLFNIDASGNLFGWAKNSSNVELSKTQVETIFDEYFSTTKTLTLPSTVKTIKANAFYSGGTKIPDCITKIEINSGCTSIEANAFTSATNVVEVVIPNTVTAIGNSAFSSCGKLATIDLSSWTTAPTWTGTGIFTGCATMGKVKIQAITNQVDQWRYNNSVRDLMKSNGGITSWTTSTWQFDHEDTATLLKVESNVVVGWSSGATTPLSDAEKLKLANDKNGGAYIIIPKAATSIAADAFVKNTIESTIPSTLPTVKFEASSVCTTIGKKAFYKAPITTLDFTNATKLTTINDHAFSGSSVATLTSLPNSLTYVGAGAFFQMKITTLKLPVFTNTITFGAGAFANNSNLTTIDLTAYSSVPTWADSTLSLFDNIKSSGTIKVSSTFTAKADLLTYMSQHSNTIAYYDTWSVA